MSVDLNKFMELAKEAGFTAAAPVDVSTLQLREEVREACAADKCHAYGHNWTCPPACGTLDECRERVAKYRTGILVQTTGQLEDNMDYETMMDTAKAHGEHFMAFVPVVRALCPDALLLGAGGCRTCETCTYPDAPCRFPDKAFSSMEGYGMVVSDVCKANNIEYYYGPNTITYVGCILLE